MSYYNNTKIALVKKDTDKCIGIIEEKYSVLIQLHDTFTVTIDDIIYDNEIIINDIIIYYTVIVSGNKDYISIDYYGAENIELDFTIDEIYDLLIKELNT